MLRKTDKLQDKAFAGPATADPQSPHHAYDRSELPVMVMDCSYPSGHITGLHDHPNAQLLHAEAGVMVISTHDGLWVVPPTRGLWLPAGVEHSVRMVGPVQMLTAFIRADAARELPERSAVLGVTPLLRELLRSGLDVRQPYSANSREGRLMALLIDELRTVRSLPLHLPQPSDPLLRPICAALSETPDDPRTAAQWAQAIGIDVRTLHRRFLRATTMSFAQWRQQARLLAALEQLAGGARVLDVALAAGYASPTAFATMFKRQFGISPSSFFD